MRKEKLAAIIANTIQKEIIDMGWPVGESLGVEPELIERYGVSRSTLREAIRQLERHSVARMRRGNQGGLIIEQPARASAIVALSTYLVLADADFEQLFEARQIIEDMALEAAAKRFSEKDIDTANALIEELQLPLSNNFGKEIELQERIRTFLRDAAGNPATSIILDSLFHVTTNDLPPKFARSEDIESSFSRARTFRLHMLEALIAKDPSTAQHWQHELLKVGKWLIHEQLLDKKGIAKPTLTIASSKHTPGYEVFNKTAQRLALTFTQYIKEAGLPPGARLGTESELRERFGLSRAVLREALRILELHAIVSGKRGNGGGFEVSTPKPDYTAEIVVNFLQYEGLSPDYFYEVWASIQLASSGLAGERITEAGKLVLKDLLELERNAAPSDLFARIQDVELTIGKLINNLPLALFSQFLGQVAVHYPVTITKKQADPLLQTHAQYVEAVILGEPELACQRMADFLNIISKTFRATGDKT